MADRNPNTDGQDRNLEVPGDTNSADIVGRTGEEMPVQSHDGVESEERRRSTLKNDGSEPVRADDDNPRGQVAD